MPHDCVERALKESSFIEVGRRPADFRQVPGWFLLASNGRRGTGKRRGRLRMRGLPTTWKQGLFQRLPAPPAKPVQQLLARFRFFETYQINIDDSLEQSF